MPSRRLEPTAAESIAPPGNRGDVVKMPGVRLLDPVTELPGLRAEWNGLLGRSRANTPFLTWEWMSLWWRHYGQGLVPFLLACRDGAGRLVGIAPLAISRPRAGGVIPLRRLGFLGSNEVCSDYLDFPAEPGCEREVVERFLEFILARQSSWDLLSLSSVPESSPTLSVITERARALGMRLHPHEHSTCAYISWNGRWEEFLATRPKSLRRHLRQQMKRLTAEGDVRLSWVEEPAALPSAFERFVAMRRRRWRHRGSFGSEKFLAFHSDVSRAFLENGWLDLSELRVGERVVAMRYAFRYDGRIFGYLPAFDLDWAKFGVGIMALALCIEQALGAGREFNLLRGISPHKLRWATGTRQNRGLEIGARHGRGRVAWVSARAEDRARRSLRRVLPRPILQTLKSLVPQGLEDE